MNNIKKGIIHNAKGDLLPVSNAVRYGNADSGSTGSVGVTFYSDGRYGVHLDAGTTYYQWVDVPYTGTLSSGYTPDPTWIGGSNYTLSWPAPTLDGGNPQESPTTSGSGSLSINRTFFLNYNAFDEHYAEWVPCFINNIATSASVSFNVLLASSFYGPI